ncbi:MAG: ribosome-associated translation inhibitor RaiA [Chloroflexi bacterium]|nr:ribosome-associated translation inhibitor RaiA [Chloroflexota bacterium]
MDVIFKTRNLDLSDTLRNYVEKKVNKLERFLPNIDQATVELAVQNSKSVQDRHVAQITLRSTNGVILRAEERSADMYASIDAALDKMTRRIRRYKGKHWKSLGRPQEEELPEEMLAEEEEEEESNAVVRTKTFPTRPMTVEEAIEQMELLGHDFFAFYNVEGNTFNVVYRRRNGGYGLLLPELV